MSKRILIATGGTGGHVYPAVGLAQQLLLEDKDNEILFVGGGLEHNRYFEGKQFDFQSVACGTFTKKSLPGAAKACFDIGRGIMKSRRIIREFAPDVAVGFGSYYSFPPLVAAKMESVPIVLHEANSIPGKVNRFLAPWAAAVGVHFPKTLNLLKGNCLEVGMPLRSGFKKGSVNTQEARNYFDLKEKVFTLLVFGGSQGAQAINQVVSGALKPLMDKIPVQVIHIAGEQVAAMKLKTTYSEAGIVACVKAFEERMDLAWQAADLALCRAGAGTIAEQFEFEVPSILVPYPRAAENHQEFNAEFIVKTAGGGRIIREENLTERLLACHLLECFCNGGGVLAKMKTAIGEYKKRVRVQDLCSLVKGLINKEV